MIHYVKGNLLDSNCDYICHQVNCQDVMGSGIARQIRERWPEVYMLYREKCAKHMGLPSNWMLGTAQIVKIECDTRCVINMFSQNNFGYYGGRHTSYDAFSECLYGILELVPEGRTIGFPKNIGCGLGGGNWKVISALIEEILGEDYEVYIYEYYGE
jgi:O-acetyl-ADP-ribose deacetylase (regulator of RNase III)